MEQILERVSSGNWEAVSRWNVQRHLRHIKHSSFGAACLNVRTCAGKFKTSAMHKITLEMLLACFDISAFECRRKDTNQLIHINVSRTKREMTASELIFDVGQESNLQRYDVDETF